MKKEHQIFLTFFVKIAFTAIFVSMLFRVVEFDNVWTALRKVDPAYFVLAMLTALVNIVWVSALRWKYLINVEVEGRMRTLCLLSLISRGLNFILPGNFIGEVVKGFNLSGRNVPGRTIVSSIIMDKVAVLTSLTILSLVGLLLTHRLLAEAGLLLCSAAIVGLLVAGVGLIYSRILPCVVRRMPFLPAVIREKLTAFFEIFDVYRRKKRAVTFSVLVALVATSLTSYTFYLIGRGLSLDIPYGIWFAYIPLVAVISRIPITIGGLGLRDGALMFLLNSLNVPSALSVSISLLFFAVIVTISVLGAVLYLGLQVNGLVKKMFIGNPNL